MSGFPLSPLLAQARIEAMSPMVKSVELNNDSSVAWLIALACAAIAFAVVACVVLQFTQRRKNGNRHLFKELCHANQLSHGQSRALHKLAKRLQIANPNRLFLETELWNPAPVDSMLVDSQADQANQLATSAAGGELHELREHLFVPVA